MKEPAKGVLKSAKGALKTLKASDNLFQSEELSCCMTDFTIGPILGTGSFGRVSLAKLNRNGAMCAIKALSKSHVIKNQQLQHLKAERDVLRSLDHPFVVKMLGCFQDSVFVYFVMEYVCGGEFFRHLKARGRLSEEGAKFYAAEVLLAFEHMHMHDIIYRDLKPENLLLESSGHIKITDLGFAKHLPGGKRTYTLCGTPDYLAPEIILNKGHGKAVDWWAFGVLIYEMIAGFPPFYDEDITNTYKKILTGKFSFPPHFSNDCRDLVRKLLQALEVCLQADLSKRIGCLAGGTSDLKLHAWFKGMDWNALPAKQTAAPIRPIISGAADHSNFDDYSSLPPLVHDFELSENEQLMFVGL